MSDSSGAGCAVLVLLAAGLWYCSSPADRHQARFEDQTEIDEDDAAVEDALPSPVVKGGETKTGYEDRQAAINGARGTYYGDTCTVDCGGHEAGRRWAERQGIDDPDDCGGKSWSFEEGCRTYAEEQKRDASETE